VLKKLRSIETIYEDELWPIEGLGDPNPLESSRHAALHTVLSTIPKQDYQKLKDQAGSFEYYWPHEVTSGEVMPFSPNYSMPEHGAKEDGELTDARVFYLSPKLEEEQWPVVVGVVAHELAHLVLGHRLLVKHKQYQRQEDEAWNKVRSWGLGRAVDACLLRNQLNDLGTSDISDLMVEE